ncbi:MAG: rhodanese-like domain-containing protein [Ketobacteraceae bacterium]|nr:rhodanese-like domain-containing protein [Ketobacteraceae bacterium]
MIRNSVFCLAIGILSQSAFADFAGEWDQKTALEKMKSPDVVVIDVRSPEEYAEGHVPGAINIPHNQMDEHQDTLSSLKGKELLLYCRSGRRAGMAESQLTEKGFENLYHLKGDMQGWLNANRAVEK